jgi:hypothetical protein
MANTFQPQNSPKRNPTTEDRMGRAIAIIVMVAVIFILFSGFAFLKIVGLL